MLWNKSKKIMKDFNTQDFPFIRQHWFKITLVILLLYAIFSKDMEIKLEFSKPDAVETVLSETSPAAPAAAQPARAGGAPAARAATAGEARAGSGTATRAAAADARAGSGNPAVPRRAEQLNIIGGYSQSTEAEDALYTAMLSAGNTRLTALAERFAQVAAAEQAKFGIPASITLASLLLHSQGGKAALVQKGNNFFAMPCTPDWLGDTVNEGGRCYRYYESAWMSIRDHSLFMTTGKQTKFRQLRGKPYREWARAIERTAVYPHPHMASQLLRTIERFELQQYD